MSYRAGLFGNTWPTIFCDGPGCGARREIDGLPPQWFMNNKAVPGWSLARAEDDKGVTRIDLCPKHRATPEAPGEPASPGGRGRGAGS